MKHSSSESITGKYRHYKGNEYEVIGIGLHTETEEKTVVYKDIKTPDKIWVRPYDMFFETVIIDGEEIPRFKKIGD